nr:ribonuclease H-like domain-containing protein [Tanacetum cinerariifolium]
MDLESAKNNVVAKLPLPKQGDYEMWKLRIEQYFQVQDYALWDVIENGNSSNQYLEQQQMQMISLLQQYQVHQYKDAKTLFEAKIWCINKVDNADIQVSAVSTLCTVSSHDNIANLSDATVYAFLANQPNGSQLVHEDQEQIQEDDLEEMDLKWQLALPSMRARRYFQRTGNKITINRSDNAGYDKIKVEYFNCYKMGHFTRECRSPMNQESRPKNQDNSRRTVNVDDTSSKAMVEIDGAGFDWSYMADDEFSTNMALMDFSDSEIHNSKTCFKTCLKSFETLKTQYDNLRIEFNKSEFNLGYGPEDSKSVCVDTSNEIKKALDAPIIKDWVSDSDDDESKVMVLKSDNVQHIPEQANQPRKMVQKHVLKHVEKGTGQREVRPVWNNTMMINHQNLSNSKRNFAPTAVLTKSRIVPISTARQSSSRAAAPVSAARPINTDAPKPLGNRVTSAVGKQGINVVKSSTCWVWRPKITIQDHVSKTVDHTFVSDLTMLIQKADSMDILMETDKPLSKDGVGTDVDVHLYRFQVQPKVSHMHTVKRIFRYLKGQPTLGLWYPKDSPLELIAYPENDYVVSTLSTLCTVSSYDNTANLSDATVYAFLANQPNGSQLVHEDQEQIHEDDLEEMDLKWQLALLSMRARRPRNQDNSRRTVNVEYTSSKAMVEIDGAGFDWSCMADDEFSTNMALMAFSDSEIHNSKTCFKTCLKSFETLKTQYDNLRIEFNKSEFNLGYRLEDSKSVCVDTSNEIKKAPDALIIEDWVSDSDDDESKVMVLKSDNVQHIHEQANQPRKVSQNPRNNSTN